MIKVLAIDDNKDNLTSLKALVNEAFPEAIMFMAENGMSGLKMAEAENPDVILLDIVMPEMDGFEVCRKLKADEKLRDIPVIFITAIKDDKESRIKALEAGGEAFLAKPVDESELTAQIRAMLKINEASIMKRDEKNRLERLVEERTEELKRMHNSALILLEDLKAENERRKQSEEALKENEQKYRMLFNSNRDSITLFGIGADGKPSGFIDFNNAACEIFGYTREELMLKKLEDIEARVPENVMIQRLESIQTKGSVDFETVIKDKDGNERFVEVKVILINYQNQPALMNITREITERKRAEEDLRESEEQLKAIFENSLNPIIIADDAGNYFKVNQAAAKMFNYPVEKMLQMNVSDLQTTSSPDAASRYQEYLNKGYEIGEFDFVRPDKSQAIAQYHAVRVRENFNLSILSDITERKQAEDALRQSEEILKSIFVNMTDVVWSLSWPDLTHNYISPSLEKLYGRSKQELMDNPSLFREITHPDDQHLTERAMKKLVEEGKAERDCRIIKPDGSIVWVNDRSKMIYDENNQPIRVEGVTRDITERKQFENELRLSEERNRLLSSVTMEGILIHRNGIAMDLNHSLSEMLGYEYDELLNRDFLEFVHHDDMAVVLENIKKEVALPYEVRAIKKNGDIFYIEVESRNFQYHDEKWRVSAIRDITARKQAEGQQRTMAEMLNLAPNSITVHDTSGRFLYANQKTFKLHGYTEPEFMAINLHNLDVPESEALLSERFRHIQESGYGSFEATHCHRDGHEIPVEIFARKVDWRGQPAFLSIATDITDRKRAEQEIVKAREQTEESEKRFRSYIQSSPTSVFIVDGNGIHTFVNNSGCKLLGYSQAEILQTSILDFLNPDSVDEGIKVFQDLKQTGEIRNVEQRLVKKDGQAIDAVFDGKKLSENEYIAFVKDITERKQAVQALRQSEERFRAANDASLDSLLLLRSERDETGEISDFIFVDINLRAEEMLRISRDHLIGKKLCEELPINREAGFFEKYRRVVETGVPLVEEFFLPETHVPACWYFHQVVKGGDGVFICHRDISERKRTEAALRQSNDIVENIQVGLYIYHLEDINDDRTLRLKFANPASVAITGLKAENITGKTLDENFPNLRKMNVPQRYAEVVRSAQLGTFEDIHYSDNRILQACYSIKAFPLPNNHVGIAFDDITENVSIIDAIAQSNIRLKEAQEVGNIGSWEYEILEDKLVWSDQTYRIYGENPNAFKLTFKEVIERYPESDREQVLKAFNEALAAKSDFSIVHRILTKSGEIRFVQQNAKVVLNDDGNPMRFIGSVIDITERKQAEDELLKAKEKAEESDNLKTAFINNISHEIRTPLNGILGFGEFLSVSDHAPEAKMAMLAFVQNSSNRLMNTMTDYMDMAMIVSETMEVHKKEFLLQTLFEEVIEKTRQLCTVKGISFEAVSQPEYADFTINSDPELISKILNILFDNALKFTEKGIIKCDYKVNNGFLEFFVRDTGKGIEHNKLEMIFSMFTQEDTSLTRGYEGSGLGLSIARGLVTLLGGSISVTSEKGKGSTFTFTIPFRKFEVAEKPVPVDQVNVTASSIPLILIAEDDESNYQYMEFVLKMFGCDILLAKDGAEAVALCRQRPEITLVLMDIKMPVMNGLEATKLIREFRSDLPIIVTTAYAQTGDEPRFLAAGCTGYLAKPIRKEKLFKLLEKYL